MSSAGFRNCPVLLGLQFLCRKDTLALIYEALFRHACSSRAIEGKNAPKLQHFCCVSAVAAALYSTRPHSNLSISSCGLSSLLPCQSGYHTLLSFDDALSTSEKLAELDCSNEGLVSREVLGNLLLRLCIFNHPRDSFRTSNGKQRR
jgi:hypothetical protein